MNLGNARTIALQFSSKNLALAPQRMRRLPAETAEQQMVRNGRRGTGEEVVSLQCRVGLEEFVDTLLLDPIYHLVDGFAQERPDPQRPSQRSLVLRFVFALKEYARPSADFTNTLVFAESALRQLSSDALWDLRIFENPIIKDGGVVPGEVGLSINLAARQPFYNASGELVLERKKDATGQKSGDAVPLEPSAVLLLEGDEIILRPLDSAVTVEA